MFGPMHVPTKVTVRCSQPLAAVMTGSQHIYELRQRKDHRDVDLICAS